MLFFYTTGIHIYGLIVRLAALFNAKARLWVKGRKGLFAELEAALAQPSVNRAKRRLAWFHCASLGEFEQGRPLLEAFKKEYPEYLVLLTFFSPSGYENRKSYKEADFICYLPLDTRRNARRFVKLVQPDLAFFVKYEFWFNLLTVLQKQKIPHFLVSAIFRPDQHFFRWYGDVSRSVLKGYTHIFVQNNESLELLEFVGIQNASKSGDTRFDRVIEIASQKKEFPILTKFAEGHRILVAGSTWPADEDLLTRFMKEHHGILKMIIAPHEIHEQGIQQLMDKAGQGCVRLSQFTVEQSESTNLIIVDSIGLLSQLYRLATYAYIGGGFGAGIHNTLEAAVYGLPVFFGPNYGKFQEAIGLISAGGAFPIHDYHSFESKLLHLHHQREDLKKASEASGKFVFSHKGATSSILDFIRDHQS
jgi:3-deoxy-D-manno-octulosonic-acid transferase